jgi:hypothetical protein
LLVNANGDSDEVRFSALAFMCLADDAPLAGSQPSPGMPTSLPQDQVLINSLSLYSSFLALKAQHAARGYDQVTISVLRSDHIAGIQPCEPKPTTIPESPLVRNFCPEYDFLLHLGSDEARKADTENAISADEQVCRSKTRRRGLNGISMGSNVRPR